MNCLPVRPTPRWIARWQTLISLACGVGTGIAVRGQDVLSPSFEGRPFMVLESMRATTNQLWGIVPSVDEWRWLGITPDGKGLRVVRDRGGAMVSTEIGPIYAIPGVPLGPNTSKPVLGPVSRPSRELPEDRAVAFAAGQVANGVYLLEGTNAPNWLPPYAPMPRMDGATVQAIEAVAYARCRVAMTASYGESWIPTNLLSGVYRVHRGGPLKVVADTTMDLPGMSGHPGGRTAPGIRRTTAAARTPPNPLLPPPFRPVGSFPCPGSAWCGSPRGAEKQQSTNNLTVNLRCHRNARFV